jgi:hypothetical protein
MISMDRQTLTLIAVIVCLIGIVVMFRELKTAKEDVEGLKGFSMNVMKRMQPVPVPQPVSPPPPPPPAPRVEKKQEEVAEEEVEEK